VSIFGFIANFLLGYIPYKLWRAITSEKPDLKSLKKLGLFVVIALIACAICGIIIGWGLYWISSVPFMPMSLLIAVSDAVWAVILGSVVLAFSYPLISKHELLYTDILKIEPKKHPWTKVQTLTVLVFAVSTLFCFIIGAIFSISPFALLPFILLSVIAIIYTFRN
jgi:energy-coupling factor transport system substrate-specific component